jgi:ssRNA-specific RNase YbeY (16S rRNA maturation enzyme)
MRHQHLGKTSADRQRKERRTPSGSSIAPREPLPPILQLAKAVGNQAFTRFVQTRDGTVDEHGAGHPLDPATRVRMEAAFGQDFSGVVIHSDAEAGTAARALNAQAFALGNHVVFDSGQYAPGSLLGDMLIAHELAHVQQQARGAGIESTSEDLRLEHEANVAAVRATTSMAGGAKAALAGVAREAVPTMKAALRPLRCPVSAQKMPSPAFFGQKSKATMNRLNDIAEAGASLSNWIRFGSAVVAFDDPTSALDAKESQEALNAVPTIVRASMKQEVDFLLVDDATGHFLNDQERHFWEALDRKL